MSRYHLYSKTAGAIIRRNIEHPCADEGPVEGMDPDLVLLRIVQDTPPYYDAATHDINPVEQIDLDASEVRVTWEIFDLPADEAAAVLLSQRRAQMATILDALPIETQAALWATRVAVEQALDRGRLDIARALVQATVVPPELESTKAAILALFPA
jgi:hypothetical protein